MKHRMLLVGGMTLLLLFSSCGNTAAEQPMSAQPTAEQMTTEENAPAEEGTEQSSVEEAPADNTAESAGSTAAPKNGPYMPLTADADVQTKNPVNGEPFPQTDIQVMFLSDLEIPAAQEELTLRYAEAGWTVTVTEAKESLVTFTAAPPQTSTWKGTCTMGLQKGSPEVMGTPKLVIKGLCYAN